MKSISFIGGFLLGLLCISLVQAALPKRVTPQAPEKSKTPEIVSELRAPKVTAPDLEQDFNRLQQAEGKYAESWDQQQRIRAATNRALPTKKKARR